MEKEVQSEASLKDVHILLSFRITATMELREKSLGAIRFYISALTENDSFTQSCGPNDQKT